MPENLQEKSNFIWEAIKEDDFSSSFLSRKYKNHQLQLNTAEMSDTLKRIALITETLKDPVSVDRAITRLRADERLARELFV